MEFTEVNGIPSPNQNSVMSIIAHITLKDKKLQLAFIMLLPCLSQQPMGSSNDTYSNQLCYVASKQFLLYLHYVSIISCQCHYCHISLMQILQCNLDYADINTTVIQLCQQTAVVC